MPDGSISQESHTAAVAAPFPQAFSGAAPAGQAARTRRAPPPLTLRFSLPLPGSRVYFALVGGRERRSRERLALERRRHKMTTRSNVLFIVIGALTFYILTLGAFLGWAAMTGV